MFSFALKIPTLGAYIYPVYYRSKLTNDMKVCEKLVVRRKAISFIDRVEILY